MAEVQQIHRDAPEGAPQHGGIAAAVVAAMADVQPLARGERNKHDGYDFASIDGFLAMVRPICAKHGLFIWMDEGEPHEFERQGRSSATPWLRMPFEITVHHTSGEKLGPITRRVEVLRNGPQAYGSAQSYVLKQFLRGLFQIATGDHDDPDMNAKADGAIAPRQTVTPEQAQELTHMAGAAGIPLETICKAMGLRTLDDLPAQKFDAMKARLSQKQEGA